MICSNCEFENPEGMNFCGKCAAPLKIFCLKCDSENPPGFAFCGKCAAPLSGVVPAELSSQEVSWPKQENAKHAKAERRNLTVLFCDLVGYTAMSEGIDPEHLREIVRAYQKVCIEVVERFDGFIAQYLGDGLLIYFGYPQAYEDAPQRAIRSGLGIVEAMVPLNSRLKLNQENQLAVRIGIHTGPVVVGEMGGGEKLENLAVGDTPNIASRLEELAESDTVVISENTYRLTRGLFECQDLGAYALKHVSQPMRAYVVLRESGAQSLFDVAAAAGLTPVVGREFESGILFERWEHSKSGMGQVVLLSGEAGIGKSRLVKVLKEHLADEPHVRSECRCTSYHQNSALYPLIHLIQRDLGFQRSDPPEKRLIKLEKMLEHYGFSLPDVLPLFASLLSIPLGKHYSPLNLPSEQLKAKSFESLLAMPLAIAREKPMLFIVEDLHWIDPSTLEWLGLLLDQVPTNRIFVLLTFRPDFAIPWPIRSNVTQLTLGRLDSAQIENMVGNIAGKKKLPPEIYHYVLDRTDGIPLFIEELTKMVLESDHLRETSEGYELIEPLSETTIPIALQDSLMARLDRLTTAKDVAQLGAALGRDFSDELLRAVSPFNDETLQQEIDRLIEAELLYRRGLPPNIQYMFKHALIQEAAYYSMLRSQRQKYHKKIAEVLEKKFPETADMHPELLAQHYTAAGLTERAIEYWQSAGHHANQRWAYVEAIEHLRKGLDLLKTLPASPIRSQKELNLLALLGVAFAVVKGYGKELEQTYLRAQQLCDRLEATPHLFSVLQGLFLINFYRADLKKAKHFGEQLLRQARILNDAEAIKVAHYELLAVSYWQGDFIAARSHVDRGMSITGSQRQSLQDYYEGFLYSTSELNVVYRGYWGRTLWMLGFPDQALNTAREALAMAQKLDVPHRVAQSWISSAIIHIFRRDSLAALKQADYALELLTGHDFPQWLSLATVVRGWAVVDQCVVHDEGMEQSKEGLSQIQQGISTMRRSGIDALLPTFLSFLADSCGKLGRYEEGINVLSEVIELMHATGVSSNEPEVHRLRGKYILGQTGDQDEAETCYLQALELARLQNARSLELRAATSMAGLWLKQNKQIEARTLLSEIYGWFTEGFDTADLKDAKALLDELSDCTQNGLNCRRR